MNIFKILSNGDGSINEPNVSAFIGYLLDPYADHGLGFEFLERFLKHLPKINDEVFNVKQYDYEIFFEQAFKEKDKKKEIVDIVIVCFENRQGEKKESYVKSVISNKKDIKSIFLIENKIRTDSITAGQLKNQYESTKKELEELKNENASDYPIYSIYLTPESETLINEFNSFEENKNKFHFVWKHSNSEENADNSILNILKDILYKEVNGEIEAINEYTKHTLKAFIQFIDSGFKSEKEEKKAMKYDIIAEQIAKIKEKIKVKQYENLQKQWMHTNKCLVHDFIIENNEIAVDTIFISKSWKILLFGRNATAKRFLKEKIISHLEFLMKPIDKNGKYIIAEFKDTDAISEVAKTLDELLKQLNQTINNI